MHAEPGELTLELRRVVAASPSAVFDAFVDPDQLSRWWGPAGFKVPSLDYDPRVGKGYRIEMQPPEGDPFHLSGEFREVDRPSRLAYTFRWEPPDPDDVETMVELSFVERGDSTEALLTQGPFKTEARRELHHDGWTDTFDRLERFMASP